MITTAYPAITEFIHDGQHVIEELDGSGACLRRFYYGDNLDELVGYDNLAFYPGPGTYFYEQDSAGDVIAIHDSAGNVVERYRFGAFGFPSFETPLNVEKSVGKSDFDNPFLFKGLRYEAYFNPLYYMRARFQDPNDGTFMQRDPLGIWGDAENLGNPKAYCGGNPVNRIDPLGLQSQRDLQQAYAAQRARVLAAGKPKDSLSITMEEWIEFLSILPIGRVAKIGKGVAGYVGKSKLAALAKKAKQLAKKAGDARKKAKAASAGQVLGGHPPSGTGKSGKGRHQEGVARRQREQEASRQREQGKGGE